MMEAKIAEFLDSLRPALNSDGGDVELVDFNEKTKVLQLRFLGACSHCSISDVTLTRYIQEELHQAFPEISEVVAV